MAAPEMKYKMLFSPTSINGLNLENRIVMAPTHIGLNNEEGFVTPEMIDFFLKRARGGVSMIIFGAVAVNPRRIPSQMRLSDDKFVPGVAELVERIHSETGAKVCAQLYDWLKFARRWKQDVHEMTLEEIRKTLPNLKMGRYGPFRQALTLLKFTLPTVTPSPLSSLSETRGTMVMEEILRVG